MISEARGVSIFPSAQEVTDQPGVERQHPRAQPQASVKNLAGEFPTIRWASQAKAQMALGSTQADHMWSLYSFLSPGMLKGGASQKETRAGCLLCSKQRQAQESLGIMPPPQRPPLTAPPDSPQLCFLPALRATPCCCAPSLPVSAL